VGEYVYKEATLSIKWNYVGPQGNPREFNVYHLWSAGSAVYVVCKFQQQLILCSVTG